MRMLWKSFVIICSFNLLFAVESSKLLHKYELDSMKNSSEMAIGENENENWEQRKFELENCTAQKKLI